MMGFATFNSVRLYANAGKMTCGIDEYRSIQGCHSVAPNRIW